jgi:hypothetical protein
MRCAPAHSINACGRAEARSVTVRDLLGTHTRDEHKRTRREDGQQPVTHPDLRLTERR